LTSPPLNYEERRGKTISVSAKLARRNPIGFLRAATPRHRFAVSSSSPYLLSDYIFLDAVKHPPPFGLIEVIKTADE
jgi:hypothetical protein